MLGENWEDLGSGRIPWHPCFEGHGLPGQPPAKKPALSTSPSSLGPKRGPSGTLAEGTPQAEPVAEQTAAARPEKPQS